MSPSRPERPTILALDGGGSKVDAALVAASGRVLGAARWHRRGAPDLDGGDLESRGADGDDRYVRGAGRAIRAACRDAGLDPEAMPAARLGIYCLAGADLPVDDRRISRAIARQGWTSEDVVRNDTFAILRAGSDRGWGIAVVCGHGMNCAGIAPNGRTFRFPAKGDLSGDWGGGADLGRTAVWFAVRAQDGRGSATSLSQTVPDHFGLRGVGQLVQALHLGHISERRLDELAPVVFGDARRGDPIARSMLDRQADEIVLMSGAAMRKLKMTALDADVVLGGGIFRNSDGAFLERIREGMRSQAPAARITILTSPPVVGAALLGLDHIGATARAAARVRQELTHDRLTGARPRRGGSARRR